MKSQLLPATVRCPGIKAVCIDVPPKLDKQTTAGGDRTVVLTYRADAFNAFNRTSFGNINGTIGNAAFGRATGPQVGARLITMGLRLAF